MRALLRALVAMLVFFSAGCRPVPHAAAGGDMMFRDVAAETGLIFTHRNGARGEYHLPEIMGSGVALLDFDNDGALDVFLVQGAPSDTHRLFRNDLKETGKLHFTDVTEQAGIRDTSVGMGAATGDYNDDGFTDIFVTGVGRSILYRNNGNGTFTNVTDAAGLSDSLWSTSASFVDYDRDGKLDLFVLHYVDYTFSNNKSCHAATGERDYCTPKAYKGVPARLYRNVGGGKFADVSAHSGISASWGPGLGTAIVDVNEDGWPDIYVANDTAQNLLWINQRNGTFRESALESGLAYAADGIPRAGMGVAVGDIDGDSTPDIVVTNLMREGITLFRGLGGGNFEDVTGQYGLARSTVDFTGFGTGLHDLDNDGDLDLFVANGAVTIMENQRGKPHPYQQRNQVLRNEGAVFRDVSAASGDAFQKPGVGRGAAFGDLDNDGDIDIVVTNNNGPVQLLLNQSVGAHWLTADLGKRSNGAVVSVDSIGFGRRLSSRSRVDSSYLSSGDGRVHFGLGDRSRVEAITVRWPEGTSETYRNVAVDRIVTLTRGTGNAIP